MSRRIKRRWWPGPEVFVPLLLVSACVGYPFFLLVTAALNVGDPENLTVTEYGLGNFPKLLEHTDWIINTLFVASVGTGLALLIGVVIAWTLHRTTVPGSHIFENLVAIPFPLGALVAALAWNILGAPSSGIVNDLYRVLTGSVSPLIDLWTPVGIAFVMALFEAPIAILIIGAAMKRMDSSLEECSAVHGANRVRTALRITMPLMAPAIASAGVFLFASMLGNFAIPAILGAGARFSVATTAIFNALTGYPPDYPLAGVLGLALLAMTAAVVWINHRVLRGRSYVVVSGKNYNPRRIDMRHWTWVLFGFLCAYVVLAVVLPLATLVLMSLQRSAAIDWSATTWTLDNYHHVLFGYPTTHDAVINTLFLGVALGIVGASIVTVIAWIVHRTKGPGRRLLSSVMILPQAFPRLVFGVGLLWVVVLSPVGLYGTLYAVFLAYVVIFLPLGYLSISGVMVQLDKSLEEAGRVSGASWFRVMGTITIPLLRAGIASTAGLLFMISIQEVSTSMFLSGPRTPVLGPVILEFWSSGGLNVVSALAVVQATIVLIALFGVSRLTAAISRMGT